MDKSNQNESIKTQSSKTLTISKNIVFLIVALIIIFYILSLSIVYFIITDAKSRKSSTFTISEINETSTTINKTVENSNNKNI